MQTGKQLLDLIHRKPSLIWGGGPYPFTSLVAFLYGYSEGYMVSGGSGGIPGYALLPEDFHQFVTERYGRTYPDGGKGWQTFIVENTNSEQEAFDLFFQLRDEYEKKKP